MGNNVKKYANVPGGRAKKPLLQLEEDTGNVLKLQRALVHETIQLHRESFEAEYLDAAAFEVICFLVVSFRHMEVDEKTLEEALARFQVTRPEVMVTAEKLAVLHSLPAPTRLVDVARFFSSILPGKGSPE